MSGIGVPNRKVGICRVCGYRIVDGHGTHDRCEPSDDSNEEADTGDEQACRRCGSRPEPWEQLTDGLCPECSFERVTANE